MAYSNSWVNNTPATPLAVTVAPTANDVLYMWVIADATVLTMTWPSGFTQLAQQTCTADGQVTSIARKLAATGSETSLSASDSQGSNLIGGVVSFSGRDNTTPEDFVTNVTNNNTAAASAWTLASGSVTPGHNGADLLAFIGHDVDGSNAVVTTFATTSGTTGAWTKRQESGSGFIRGAIGTATQTTAGAFVVTATGTSAGEHAGRSLITIGIKAASGATSHATSGALTGPDSTIAGTSVHKTKHTSSGALTGPGAVIAGASVHKTKHPTSGAITGPGTTIAGVAKRFRAHPSSGALTGPGSTVAGTAKRFRSHGTSGTIAGPGATLAGTAAHTAASGAHGTSGALVGAGAILAGVASRIPGTSHSSGGYFYGGRRRTKAEIRAERIAYGILKKAPEAVQAVAQMVIEARGTPLALPEDEQAALLRKMLSDDRLTLRNTMALNAALVQIIASQIEQMHEERAIVQLLMEL